MLSTKIGRLLVDGPVDETTKDFFIDAPEKQVVYDYTYDGVMRSHDASLARLGVDAIDILLVHDVDVWTHGSQAAADEKVRELFDGGGYRALDELKAAGRIAAIGGGRQRVAGLRGAAPARATSTASSSPAATR